MDKPAAIEGCYVDLKFMPGIKCARVSIDIPIEHSNAFLKMFDAPDRANPVPVVVARLATSTAKQSSNRLSGDTENGPDSDTSQAVALRPIAEAQGQDKPRTYSRSQIAAMKCQDPTFCGWIVVHPHAVKNTTLRVEDFDTRQHAADHFLKSALDITSKTELDVEGPKAQAFDALCESFKRKDQVR